MRKRTLLVFVCLAACGDDGNSSGIPDECNPLGGEGCLLPWPSLSYAKTDGATATGYRLDLPIEAMPTNSDKIAIDPKPFERWDGFSPTGPMLAMFPTGVSVTGLPSFKNPDDSLAANSPIVLLDLDTGERAPFFAEIDQNSKSPDQALIIRPLARLHEKTHYAVAIRNTVKAADGGDLPVSKGFAALRDGKSFPHPRFKAMAARASDMFAKLAQAGVDKSELVLAWDFVTASDEMLRSDLTQMRAAALPAIGDKGANLTFTAQAQTNTAQSYKRYLGTFKSPNFLDQSSDNPDAIMTRDSSGNPMMQGMRDARFAAIVPACVQTQPLPRPTIVFGHGLFGSAADYLDDGFVQQLAEDQCLVILAGDFIGFTSRDLSTVSLAINDVNRGATITEKLAQSIIDFIALESITRGPMVTAPEFQFNGKAVIDPARTFYVGGSLGGIMGNVFMAYDPNITRGVLAVPGGIWSMLTERSNAWSLLIGAAQGSYPDPKVYELNVAFLGMGLEVYDPITTAAHVIKDPLFGNPVKNILMWYTLGDCLVTNIATEVVLRTMGIDILGPSVRSPWSMQPKTGAQTNGAIAFDDHPTPLPPETNVPPATDNGTHSGINRKPAALRMVQKFLLENQAIDQCMVGGNPAPCDCATGACN